jgi:hypothetical protein
MMHRLFWRLVDGCFTRLPVAQRCTRLCGLMKYTGYWLFGETLILQGLRLIFGISRLYLNFEASPG